MHTCGVTLNTFPEDVQIIHKIVITVTFLSVLTVLGRRNLTFHCLYKILIIFYLLIFWREVLCCGLQALFFLACPTFICIHLVQLHNIDLQHFILPMTGLHDSNLLISCLLRCFAIIINRFLTHTRNIVHFGVTLYMLFTYLHTVLCVYMYIQLYTIMHTYTYNIHTWLYTDIHIYIHTYTCIHIHKYIYVHYTCTYTYLHMNTYPWYLHVNINIYTHTYMHIHTCIQLYIHELSMSYACIKYTYIAYIYICVLVEFCVSFMVTF